MSHRQPFFNIRTEGALLPSDLLSRLMEGTNLAGLKPEDYHLGAGEKLNEAVSRSWARLLSLWLGFRKAQAALPASDLGTTLTREKWLLQLFQELGYGRLIASTPFEIDEKTYPISHVWPGQYYQVPIHLVSFRADLDKRSEQRIQGASKASPHGMVQEFLNRSEHHLWAFVSNGLKLLILRDNASLTRQAYVEFDLEAIFESKAYSDFRLLWLVCHQSRLEGTAKDRPETCWLELWSKQAQTDGRRALDLLRVGVEKALENFGTGFISHKANQALCQGLKAGELNKQDFYRQLLRLVYRLIFLFVVEDRDLLHFPGASDEARLRYARFYSGQRLRRMAERTRGSRHADLWVGLRLVFAKLGDDRGCPELGLPALGGFLFGPQAMPDLESAELANEHLLQAIRNLGLVKDRSGWRLVDYRNLGSEELGSVYESLLELNPTMELDAGVFSLTTVAGNQRKTSGSYYTPDSLVQCLLDSALDPVVEQATKGKTSAEAEKAILALKVCDPAVGSGHFLVGAAHRLAKHLAQVRAQAQSESEPSPLYYQHALRDVIGHCLYGVDVNPMAAELCRVSLWLEAIEPGKPLSFLDHHIQVGNALLGATPALLTKGIPDDAFTPNEGDDKEVCAYFKRVNKREHAGFMRLFAATTDPRHQLGALATSMAHLDAAPDDSIEALHSKELMYEAIVHSSGYLDGQFWADTWCAAFVWRKTREFNYPITEEVFRRIEHNPHTCDAWMREEIERLARQYRFFHWHLAFPDVFHVAGTGHDVDANQLTSWNGGFDVVLGNPPWVRQELLKSNKPLFGSFQTYCSTVDSSVLFLERAVQICLPSRFIGLLTPNKWFRAAYGELLRVFLREHSRIHLLVDFGHSHNLFPEQDTFPAAVILQPVRQRVPAEDTFRFVLAHDSNREICPLDQLISDRAIVIAHSQLKPDRLQLEEASDSKVLDRLMATGTPLAKYAGQRPIRGILTGLNEAYYISTQMRDRIIAYDPTCEPLIKRFLRGRDVKRWSSSWGDQWHIVIPSSQNRTWPWTTAKSEGEAERIFAETYPALHDHLKQFEEMLRKRSDRGTFWWELRSCDYYERFDQPKIVVQCIGYFSRFALDNDGQYVNNKILFIPSGDLYLLAILNSRVSWWIINRTFQHMKDDGISVDVQYLMALPVPLVEQTLYLAIKEVVHSLLSSSSESQSALELKLNELVNEAFQLTEEERVVIERSLPLRDPIAILTDAAQLPTLAENVLAMAHPVPEELTQIVAVSRNAFSGLSALPEESWATPVGVTPENVALFSLIDILRSIHEAVDPERIRLAAILVRKPFLASAFMDDAQAKHWLRLIGSEARPVRANVVQISQFQKNGVDYPWAEAIRQLRGSGALVVDATGKWSAGARMPASSGQDWIAGRTSIAVQLLSAIDTARVEQKLIAFNRSVEDGTARRAVS
jgi:hypothetical protein